MKKINNKGWGLTVFLVFIFIFFFTILLVAYLANKNGIGPQDTNNNYNNLNTVNYKEYENIVREKAIIYQEVHYPEISEGDSFYVNIRKLEIDSKIKNSCTGYVKLGKSLLNYTYEPYLNCGSYVTNGYDADFDN